MNNGSPDQNIAVGMDNPPTNCVADASTQVDTGVSASVLDALNTRFDMYQNGWGRNTCLPHASCSPAWNTTKDVVRNTAASASACGYLSNNEWYLPPTDEQYIASNTAGDDSQHRPHGLSHGYLPLPRRWKLRDGEPALRQRHVARRSLLQDQPPDSQQRYGFELDHRDRTFIDGLPV